MPCSRFWRPSPHARIEKSPCKRSCKRFERVYCVIFFARRGFRCRRGRCGCVANSIMEKSRHPRDVRGCGRFISTALPGSPNGGASRPDCNLTLKAAPGHMLRACPTRAANKARPYRAGRRRFIRLCLALTDRVCFPTANRVECAQCKACVARCEIFAPQQQAEHIARCGTPARWKAWLRTKGLFYAPRKSRTRPATAPAGCAPGKRPANDTPRHARLPLTEGAAMPQRESLETPFPKAFSQIQILQYGGKMGGDKTKWPCKHTWIS